MAADSLAPFSRATREWFESCFPAPTPAQAMAWLPISAGEHTLLCAPTGSGKTLAAFLWAIDSLGRNRQIGSSQQGSGVRVLYISPMRALAVDVEKNLKSPLRGVALAAERLGVEFVAPTVGVRTGDSSAKERRDLVRNPPEILITTPESLYLMLTSAARESLLSVDCVIVDEIHALAPTKRGAHLSLSLERLEHLIEQRAQTPRKIQRIGLSATQRPLEAVASFLGGFSLSSPEPVSRPVTIVDAGMRKELELSVVVPVEELNPANGSAWPSMDAELLQLIEQNHSTLLFVNARRMSERLASRLNELALEQSDHPAESDELVRAHHGSLSRERRLIVEDELKRGELKGLVATSSLELGIDMGAVDLVIQVASPGSVASGMQRIGRAGHQVGVASRGRIFPKHRADLLEAAVVAQRMQDGLIEHTKVPVNPLDVLAQQVVACCALDEWQVTELFDLCRSAANYATLSWELFENTLDLLAGRYPAEEFSELRPRVVWDRIEGTVRGRAGAQRLAVTSGGTIPDRGLFGVFLPDGTRVGELDEEMVYESRVGETFLLGASTWRIEEITFERVIVTPAPGQPGKMPFWHGDGPGREAELGRALGEFLREIVAVPREQAADRLRTRNALDDSAVSTLLAYLDEQAEATGVIPSDRTLVIERFRDEIGDWRVCIHSPFGSRVHAPWATIIRTRLDAHFAEDLGDGFGAEVLWSDDGIVVRLPEAAEDLPLDLLLPDPDEVEPEVVAALPGTAAFAARFREAAARALLLPRRRPGQRTPLWQQRQRAADLLSVASKYPSFPILLETTRECCNDIFDLPALRRVMTEVRSRKISVVEVETPVASPFARSLLFGWIAVFMYEGDAPLAERRAAALSLDRDLLRDLLGAEELRSLLDAEVIDLVEMELQRLTPERAARDTDELHDALRVLGPLTQTELAARVGTASVVTLQEWLDHLVERRRVIQVSIAGELRYAAAEDAARLRDALGVAIPLGLPTAFTDSASVESGERPLRDLVERFARTHGPFSSAQLAARLGISAEVARLALAELVGTARLLSGEFLPAGTGAEFCDAEVLRRLRRRSLAALRKEVEPVDAAALARFLPRWQGIGSGRSGVEAVAEAVALLQGAALPGSLLEADVLSQRVKNYSSADLDLLCATGEVVWLGAGGVGANDGRVRLMFRDQVALLLAPPLLADESATNEPHHQVMREHLRAHGASFWADIMSAVAVASLPYDEQTILASLWDLVWAGEVTNDSLSPLRSKLAAGSSRTAAGARSRAASGAASRRPSAGRARRSSRVSRLGPPAGAGRWSLTAPLFLPLPTPTEFVTQRAVQLLERYGVLTREMALAEGVAGGFAGVYPVLKLLEERGQVRRGYFVDGLGAAQFAKPGAVDLLRSLSLEPSRPEADGVHKSRNAKEPNVADGEGFDSWVLAATDPAQPYGAAVPWPASGGRPTRAIGAYVVLVNGHACAYLERGGKRLFTFESASEYEFWPQVLGSILSTSPGATSSASRSRIRRLRIESIDGESAAVSPWADALRKAGFTEGYKGLSKGA
ncbi:MAG: crosslink repair DNA glycosylase YcaQ family protein [Actinomycetes bacterium]